MSNVEKPLEKVIDQQDEIIRPIEKEGTSEEDERLPETNRRRLKLYRAALAGDWKAAEGIYNVYEDEIRARISKTGDTALHIAVAAKRTNFVKELLQRMDENDLVQTNHFGSTALFLAAASGNVELAKEIMKKSEAIAKVQDRYGTSPISVAASLGHKEMVEYLHQKTKDSLTEYSRVELFITCIEADLYDVALRLLVDDPYLATARRQTGETALHVLARKDLKFSNLANQNQQGIFRRCFCAKVVENNKRQAVHLVECIWQKVVLLNDHDLSELIAKPRKLIFDAAESGNVELLSILIREYPDLIWKVDNPENKYSIFHVAVKNRQEDIFKLLHEIDSSKAILFGFQDREDNNILHLAGKLASQDRLNIVPGEALQFQRELMWFQEVEKVVPKWVAESRNRSGFTPRALFLEEHTELKKNGERWMKETTNACIVGATLTATIAFTAALTVPGGNNQDTGFPNFIGKVTFKVFAISDAISLILSLISMATFLNIFVARYTAEDLLWRLSRKFYIGMLSLLISLVALVIVFSATFFIFFNNRRLWIAVLFAGVAPTPILMFLLQNIIDILYNVLRMNYNSYSPFQRGHDRLFLIEPEASGQHQESKKNNAESNV